MVSGTYTIKFLVNPSTTIVLEISIAGFVAGDVGFVGESELLLQLENSTIEKTVKHKIEIFIDLYLILK